MVLPRHGRALEHENTALWVVLLTLGERLLHDSAGRKPGSSVVGDVPVKLFADALTGREETGVLGPLGLFGIGRLGVVPVGVQTADDGAEGEPAVAEPLLEAGSFDSLGVVDGDTVVVGVEGLDKVLVDLVVQELHLGGVLWLVELLGEDLLSEVQEHKTRARQLGLAARERHVEAALVVVVAVTVGIVLTANVDNGVARLEDLGIPGSDEGRVTVGGERPQHVYGESLVGVEVAIVGADEGTVGLEAFGSGFGHLDDEAAEHKPID